jgi:ketosteroid isomerase-like protein
MIRRRLHEAPPHVREIVPGIPRQLDALITKMLARSSSERLANGAEVRDALDPATVLAGYDDSPRTGARARPNLQATRVGPVAGNASLQPTVRMPTQRQKSRSPMAGILIAVVIAALGTVTYLQRDRLGLGRFIGAAAERTATTHDTTARVRDSVANASAKTLPNLDSISKAREAKRLADSAAEAARADSALLHAPLDKFANAFNTSDVQAVIQQYPSMPDALREQLKNFMSGGKKFRATPVYGPATITGDHAELPFRVHLRVSRNGTVESVNADLRYHAVLTKDKDTGHWKIAQLNPDT